MPIQSGDIKLLASKVMDDVPEGGGGPSGTVILDGKSNMVFKDVNETERAGGVVNIRQLFAVVQTLDRDTYGGANIIVSKPPNDPDVSITLAKTGFFARRSEIAQAIADYLIRGPAWGGYLLENHVKGQRRIQLFQRPGSPMPPIGRTLVLVYQEGLPGEVLQYVRTTRVESEIRMFYDADKGTDFAAQVVSCDLSDALRTSFLGSPPSRTFAASANRTMVRATTVADAANFFGTAALSAPALLTDSVLKVDSIYTQLVPSSRTETIALDQKPAAQRSFTLAESPRLIEVGLTPHSMRVRVGQENRGFSWVQILKPNPAPNTIVVSFRALGQWYTLQDNGLGELSGAGVGTVNYATGSIAVTLPSMPDEGSSLIYSWGERTAYTDRKGQAGFRAPEYSFAVANLNIKPGTLTVKWLSGGVLKTATDNGAGAFTGHATGEINYAAGKLRLKLSAMIDAGGQFQITYQHTTTVTKNVTGVSPDAGGFATVALDDVPVKGTLLLTWYTVRNVSNSSGATAGSTVKNESVTLGALPAPAVASTSYAAGRSLGNTPQGFPTATA